MTSNDLLLPDRSFPIHTVSISSDDGTQLTTTDPILTPSAILNAWRILISEKKNQLSVAWVAAQFRRVHRLRSAFFHLQMNIIACKNIGRAKVYHIRKFFKAWAAKSAQLSTVDAMAVDRLKNFLCLVFNGWSTFTQQSNQRHDDMDICCHRFREDSLKDKGFCGFIINRQFRGARNQFGGLLPIIQPGIKLNRFWKFRGDIYASVEYLVLRFFFKLWIYHSKKNRRELTYFFQLYRDSVNLSVNENFVTVNYAETLLRTALNLWTRAMKIALIERRLTRELKDEAEHALRRLRSAVSAQRLYMEKREVYRQQTLVRSVLFEWRLRKRQSASERSLQFEVLTSWKKLVIKENTQLWLTRRNKRLVASRKVLRAWRDASISQLKKRIVTLKLQNTSTKILNTAKCKRAISDWIASYKASFVYQVRALQKALKGFWLYQLQRIAKRKTLTEAGEAFHGKSAHQILVSCSEKLKSQQKVALEAAVEKGARDLVMKAQLLRAWKERLNVQRTMRSSVRY